MRQTESTIALSSWVLAGFLTVSALMGLIAGDGRFAGQTDPSVTFLLRPWVWPQAGDWPILALLGVAMAGGGLMITQAYRTGPAALIAPFEYVALPMAVFWGLVIFSEWPDLIAWCGIALILMAGLYVAWREARLGRG
jgi:drug/metabolite transporter (DMT)-like permease